MFNAEQLVDQISGEQHGHKPAPTRRRLIGATTGLLAGYGLLNAAPVMADQRTADLHTVVLTAASPQRRLRGEGRSIGLLNPTCARVYVAAGGGSANAATHAPSCPPEGCSCSRSISAASRSAPTPPSWPPETQSYMSYCSAASSPLLWGRA